MSYPAPIFSWNANGKQLHPLMAFSRASQGTEIDGNGLIRTVNAGVPRFTHDPLTGICKGLLVEPQCTNYTLYSGDISNAAGWADPLSNVTRTTGSTDPSGGTSAVTISKSVATDALLRATMTLTSDTNPICFSIYAKDVDGLTIQLKLSDTATWTSKSITVNLTSRSVSTSDALVGYGAIPSYSGFTRYWFSVNNWSKSTFAADIWLVTQGKKGIAWGAQVERGSYPTSYTQTTSAGVTRAADLCSVNLAQLKRNGNSLWNGTEGTIIVDFEIPLIGYGYPKIAQIYSGTTNKIGIYYRASNRNLGADITTAGTVVANLSLGTIDVSSRKKVAFAFSSNSQGACVNGGSVITAGAVTLPSPLSMMALLNDVGADIAAGNIKSFQLYNRRISDADLVALSAL